SNIYFSTSTDSLALHEAAMLVGMAKNPALYNPFRRPDMVQQRRNVVFHQMKRNDLISREELDSLNNLPLGLKPTKVSHIEGLAPYFREVLRLKLKNILTAKDEKTGAYKITDSEGKPFNIYEDGLKVYTTIDSRLQAYAEFAVREHLSKELQPEFNRELEKRDRWNKDRIAYDWRLGQADVDMLIDQTIRRSDRYREELNAFIHCEGCNPSEAEIERFKRDSIPVIFNRPVPMKIFGYEGEIDTILSPLDSIKLYKKFLQAGMVSIEPGTGFVKAWVGGIDYKHFKFDHVEQGKNQVGSTFKPFVYATGIREGLDPCLQVPNTLTCFDMPAGQPRYCPKNSDGKYGGMVTLKEALAKSMNNITAWVMKKYGPEAVAQLARDLGITTRLDPVPSLCLGVADVNLLEITAANATFANKGVHLEPIFITRIEDKNGNPLYDAIPKTNEALDERTAYIMLDMLKAVVNFGSANRLRRDLPYGNIPYPIAGKTGTTQSNSDGWFIGLTPDLVTGVWVGGEERAIRFASTRLGQGANMALPIFGYYMNRVYRDKDIEISKGDFEAPTKSIGISLDCGERRQDLDFDDKPDFNYGN
ncbi:MAG: penicillin-binding transpeptidase domain-containing protein, partial [Luteibaculum sp.]